MVVLQLLTPLHIPLLVCLGLVLQDWVRRLRLVQRQQALRLGEGGGGEREGKELSRWEGSLLWSDPLALLLLNGRSESFLSRDEDKLAAQIEEAMGKPVTHNFLVTRTAGIVRPRFAPPPAGLAPAAGKNTQGAA